MFIPKVAPSAAHGNNYKNIHRRMATTDRDMKLLNMMQQTPEYAKRLRANIAFRQNFLDQQACSNVLNEIERLKGVQEYHRNSRLVDGRAFQTRINALEERMASLTPQPLAGPGGLYHY